MLTVASSDGVTLAIHELGAGPVDMLLAHATGLHARCWEPVAEDLGGFRLLAPDLRGHGDSPAADDHAFHWDGFADDVLAVVDGLGLDRPVGVGHSKGGAALLLAEQRRPGTFAGLWCFEPVVFPGRPPSGLANPLAEGARRRRERFGDRAEALANYASKPPFSAVTAAAREAYVDGGFTIGPDGSLRLKCRPEHEARVYEMGARHDAFEHLAEVHCPVVIARGHVGPGPAGMADAIADRLPDGRLLALDHLGHFGPLEAPAEIAGHVAAFASSVADGPSSTVT